MWKLEGGGLLVKSGYLGAKVRKNWRTEKERDSMDSEKRFESAKDGADQRLKQSVAKNLNYLKHTDGDLDYDGMPRSPSTKTRAVVF